MNKNANEYFHDYIYRCILKIECECMVLVHYYNFIIFVLLSDRNNNNNNNTLLNQDPLF
jgi:hypothetical protein